jgi:preprotein translocase subunit SecE
LDNDEEGIIVSERHELSGTTGRTSPTTFYRQVVAELRKVVWPTRPMVVNYFFVVLVFVLFMMAFVAGLDYGFGRAMFAIFA